MGQSTNQGLTFERAIIDAQAAFAHGQVYVALSRCKSFEGIVLRSRITPSSVRTDSVVKNYMAPEANAELQSRVTKTGVYFTEKIGQGLLPATKEIPTATDDRGSDENRIPKDVPHPILHKRVLDWRQEMADEQGVRPWEVLTNVSMQELVTFLPTNNRHLMRIKGIGKRKLKRYGDAILKIIEDYSREEKISVNVTSTPDAPKRLSKDTKFISLEMFEAGQSIDEIAKKRTLARTTIESHLAFHVGEGRLDIARVLTPEKIADITDFFTRNPTATVAYAKDNFGGKYSCGELKMVAWRLRPDEA